MIFDEIFSEQVIKTGKIEDGRTVRRFFKRTGQAMMQPWMVEMVKSMMRNLPIGMLTRLGLANFITPRTKGWSGARDAINEYVAEREAHHRKALKLDELVQMAETELN
jgi:heterodisulfide reductase subunit C